MFKENMFQYLVRLPLKADTFEDGVSHLRNKTSTHKPRKRTEPMIKPATTKTNTDINICLTSCFLISFRRRHLNLSNCVIFRGLKIIIAINQLQPSAVDIHFKSTVLYAVVQTLLMLNTHVHMRRQFGSELLFYWQILCSCVICFTGTLRDVVHGKRERTDILYTYNHFHVIMFIVLLYFMTNYKLRLSITNLRLKRLHVSKAIMHYLKM